MNTYTPSNSNPWDSDKIQFVCRRLGFGCSLSDINKYSNIGASAIGLDWTCSARNARYLSGNKLTLQGNLDPSRLFSSKDEIKKHTKEMLSDFGKEKYIANLGHGILPNTPVDNVKVFINTIKESS